MKKGIERHHIFPRAYLQSRLNITDTKEINQIANMALVEWADNIAISDDAPALYWPAQLAAKRMPGTRWHARCTGTPCPRTGSTWPTRLPRQRRKLMAKVVRDAYAKLREHEYTPVYPGRAAFTAMTSAARAPLRCRSR